MTVLPINTNSTALFFTDDDLSTQGFCADTLTEDDVLMLARSALRQFDLTLSELEAYAGQYGLLIFTYTVSAQQRLWYFQDFELLLNAAAGIDMTGGSLYQWQDGWWLISHDPCDGALAEFAVEIKDTDHMPCRVKEYGELIIPTDTFSTLRKNFIN